MKSRHAYASSRDSPPLYGANANAGSYAVRSPNECIGEICVIGVTSFDEVCKDGNKSRTNLWTFLKILSRTTKQRFPY